MPAFSFPVSKIVVIGNGAGSAAVKMNIYVGKATVSTETTGCGTGKTGGTASTLTYNIAEASQAAGTRYQLQVTSAHNAQITSIKIYKAEETVTKHTLSSAVTPVGAGTVTLGATEVGEGKTTSIKAEANDGYRFVKWTVTGTGASVTTDTDAETTFTMGTTEATVTANFEEIPSHTLSYVVTPTDAGTVTLSASSVREGSTATAEAAANAGYKFTGWSVSGTGATLTSTTDNPTTVTMGTADATLTATFAEVETRPVNWFVNGTKVRTDNVAVGDAITFAAPVDGIPTGYAFKYWSSSEIDGVSATEAGTKVSSQTAETGVTYNYYAVMAITDEVSAESTLSGTDITTKFKAHAYNDDEESQTVDGATWAFKGSRAASNPWMQIRKDNTASYMKIKAEGIINSINLQISNASNTKGGSNDITKHGDFAGTVYLESSYQSSPSGALAFSTVPASAKEVTIDIPGSASSEFYVQVSAPARIWNVVVSYTKGSSYNYCTTVPTATITISDKCTDGTNFFGTYYTDVAYVMPEGVVGQTVTVANNTLTVTDAYAAGSVVPANVALLLKAETAGNKVVTLTTGGTAPAQNMLKGTLTADDVTEGDDCLFYRLTMHNGSKIGFWWGAAEGAAFKPGAHKAYLAVPESVVNARLGFAFGDDSETTGIEGAAQGQTAGLYYDLQGRRVAQSAGDARSTGLKKGLYIVNGKKVIVK